MNSRSERLRAGRDPAMTGGHALPCHMPRAWTRFRGRVGATAEEKGRVSVGACGRAAAAFAGPVGTPGILFRRRLFLGALGAALLLLAGTAEAPVAAQSEGGRSLKIGFLIDFSGGTLAARDRQRAFDLAIKHVNEGGGVFGRPVTVAVGDATARPDVAVAEARRLVDVEGVHAIVGPNSSASALPVAERVTGPAGIPTVSFSATSPRLTTAADNDFLFRTALSDVTQGPVLAEVARDRGFSNIGLIHIDDAWGKGLADAFGVAWKGPIKTVATKRDQASFLAELRASASGGAQALVVITFEGAAITMVREALDHGIYERFVFGDGAKRIGLVQAVGGARLGGMYGTGPAAAPDSRASAAWEAAYVDEYGSLPVLAYVKETYDATIALALAAEAAGSTGGTAIRDHLRTVGSGPGTVVTAGPRGVAEALRILSAGGEVDYEGAANSVDWDENGDLRRGHIGIWRFTGDERVEDVRAVTFGR